MHLGSECSLRQRVPLGAVSFESLSPENESISGSTEDPDVVREEPPLWWTPHNPLSPGCFWAMTPGLPEDFRSLPSLPKSGGNSSPPQAAAPEARGSYKSSSPGSASRSRSASAFRPRHGRLLPLNLGSNEHSDPGVCLRPTGLEGSWRSREAIPPLCSPQPCRVVHQPLPDSYGWMRGDYSNLPLCDHGESLLASDFNILPKAL